MQEIARALWNVMAEYGVMKIIQSDNGLEFVNQVVRELTELYGIEHRLITAYHPSANGLVECCNKDVKIMLRKYMSGEAGNWELWLPLVQLCINDSSFHTHVWKRFQWI
jgi:transposase InsO family protein